MGRVRENATYEDLMKVPDIMVAELIEGELYAWPRPARPHARAASRLGMKIGSAFDIGETGPGGWWIVVEPELHFVRNVLVPDIAGWKRDRAGISRRRQMRDCARLGLRDPLAINGACRSREEASDLRARGSAVGLDHRSGRADARSETLDEWSVSRRCAPRRR